MRQLIVGVIILLSLVACENKEAFVKQKIKEYEKKALQGDVESQYELASIYYFGKGVEVNYPEYFKWKKMTADNGDPISQYLIGNAYKNGIGVEIDFNQAFNYYQKSADGGYPKAQFMLSRCYSRGTGVKKDIEKSLVWLIISRKNGIEEVEDVLKKYKEAIPEIYDRANIQAKEWLANQTKK